jgi:hypothetical protein
MNRIFAEHHHICPAPLLPLQKLTLLCFDSALGSKDEATLCLSNARRKDKAGEKMSKTLQELQKKSNIMVHNNV